MQSIETESEGVIWIHLAKDMDKWRTFGDKAMKLRVS
jgi:hypothetical protein